MRKVQNNANYFQDIKEQQDEIIQEFKSEFQRCHDKWVEKRKDLAVEIQQLKSLASCEKERLSILTQNEYSKY